MGTDSYTIVLTDNYVGNLEDHPILTQFSNDFEISEDELPEYIQYVKYE